jgi:malate dehydrogenase (oxaloacetate-decarboxylating)(NADP+)
MILLFFAMANPDPEIEYNLAISTRSDLIMATGLIIPTK